MNALKFVAQHVKNEDNFNSVSFHILFIFPDLQEMMQGFLKAEPDRERTKKFRLERPCISEELGRIGT